MSVEIVEPELTMHAWTVDQFHQMARAGLLDERARVELVEGRVVDMSPIGFPHLYVVRLLTRFFVPWGLDHGRQIVDIQGGLVLSGRTQLQPDVVVSHPQADDYRGRHLTGSDVTLVIEVSDSSLGYDRLVKRRLYAQAGIAEYWIADVEAEAVEVYRDPVGGAFPAPQVYGRGSGLIGTGVPDLEVTLEDIFGPPEHEG